MRVWKFRFARFRYKGRRRIQEDVPFSVNLIVIIVEFTKALKWSLVFNLIMYRRKRRRNKKKKRRKKSLGLLCIRISLVFSRISFLKAIFPWGGCYLHTRQPDGGHYKKDRCRLKYKATVDEEKFYIFFFKKFAELIQGTTTGHPLSVTRGWKL